MSESGSSASRRAGHPVFVGGSGRSGTTITGALIASHRRYAALDFEVKVHLAPAFLMRTNRDQKLVVDEFRARFDSHLHRVMTPEQCDELVGQLEAARDGMTRAWGRTFVETLMAPVATAQEKRSWLEMTPLNALWTDWLGELFPNMRMVHMLRDGRDVAFSTAASWGRMNPAEALEWWGERIRRIAASVDRAVDVDVLHLRFERLALTDREAALQELADFVGVKVDGGMAAFFEQQFQPDRANIGRWRRDLDDGEQAAFTASYRTLVASLRDNGIPWLWTDDEIV